MHEDIEGYRQACPFIIIRYPMCSLLISLYYWNCYSLTFLFQYFHGIVGFFVCEDHILNTGGGLVSKGYLEEVHIIHIYPTCFLMCHLQVWGGATAKIVATLRTHSAYCTNASLMLKIKNLIMLFARWI